MTLPTNGYLLTTYEKKTINLGSDASSGIIDFYVNDVLTNTNVYVPFRYEVNMVTLQDESTTLDTITLIEIDGIAQKSIEQYPGIHYFDLSHSSMTGNTFALSLSPDNTLSGQSFGTGMNNTDVSSVGTPGSAGAYLRVITTINTPNLYYHGSTAGLGGSFINMNDYDYVYTVKVVTNEVGKEVYAIDVNGDGVFYNQPDISFNGGFKYLFDVSDPTNSPYTLTFGTVVDGTGEESYISRINGKVLLDLITYVETEPFRYFEDTSVGMGYSSSVPINYTHYYPMDTGHIQNSTYALYEFKTNTYDPSATIVNYDVTSEISNNQLYLPSTSSTTYVQKQFSSSQTTGTLSFWYTP